MAQADSSAQREQYTIGFGAFVDANMRQRSLASAADFFLPYLRPGMRLLDVGCGPGAITLGLAEVVAPGEVVGLDVAPLQVERAQALAEERHVPNVRFEQGDAYALPFPDAAFDAVFASALLMHLRDPLAALREFRRVLRPAGGSAAVPVGRDVVHRAGAPGPRCGGPGRRGGHRPVVLSPTPRPKRSPVGAG